MTQVTNNTFKLQNYCDLDVRVDPPQLPSDSLGQCCHGVFRRRIKMGLANSVSRQADKIMPDHVFYVHVSMKLRFWRYGQCTIMSSMLHWHMEHQINIHSNNWRYLLSFEDIISFNARNNSIHYCYIQI